jgi:LysM repeat protein
MTETVAAPSVLAATYRDEVGGWEIDYPETWSLTDVEAQTKQESLGYSVTLTSWQPQEPGTQGIPEGGSKVDIGVTKGGASTVDAAIEARRAEILAGDAGSQIVFEEPWDLASGLSGVHWRVQPSTGEAVHEFVTAIGGNRVTISGYGDELLFEQIVSTLRPLGAAKASEVLVPMVGAGGATGAAAAAAPEASTQAATVYTVRAGDTLAKIAARFGVSVSALLAANPRITNPDRIYIGQRITIPGPGGNPPPPPAGPTRVNIYMIGEGGGNVGCGDQVVPVRRDVPRTNAPLTAALNLLLSQKSEYYGESGLRNALWQSDLSVARITRSGSAWTINLTGSLRLGGVCDNPRVQAQLEQTALQFSTVRSVRYFVNGTPLETLLSGR